MTQNFPRFQKYWLSLFVSCSSKAESLCFSFSEAPSGLSESGISHRARISAAFIHDLSTFSFKGQICPTLNVEGKQLTSNYGSVHLNKSEIEFKDTKKPSPLKCLLYKWGEGSSKGPGPWVGGGDPCPPSFNGSLQSLIRFLSPNTTIPITSCMSFLF